VRAGEPIFRPPSAEDEVASFRRQLDEEQADAEAETDREEKRGSELEAAARAQRQRLDRAWQARLGLTAADLPVLQGRARALLRGLHARAWRARLLAEDAARLETESVTLEHAVAEARDQWADRLAERDTLRAGLYASLLGVVVLPWGLVRLVTSLRRARERKR